MNLSTGIDMIEVERITQAIERHGERFLTRIFTQKELDMLGGNVSSLAARWAAKEAVAKALGTGIGDVDWVHIEILRGPNKEPVLNLFANAKQIAEERGFTNWSVSLSHTHEHAIAMVVAQGS